MPELPEVETTVRSLNKLSGLSIKDFWTSYNSPFYKGKENIKDKKYLELFKKNIIGKKIQSAERKAKNILIHLNDGITILVHMKMTGHFLHGEYKFEKNNWKPTDEKSPLNDMHNKFVRAIFTLSDGKHLAFSDMRKFAKINFFKTDQIHHHKELSKLGPEPLDKKFSFENFKNVLLKKPKGKIKQVLMMPEIISGIGNIYSDEILWASGIHPLSSPINIPNKNLKEAFEAMKEILESSIKTGGDSMSDFRKIDGTKGGFQNFHKAYKKLGEECSLKNCKGSIKRIKVGGRSAHFCEIHQKMF
jgi:formamidopyrimidine-DNA glycosylase